MTVKISDRLIGVDHPPFVIAEMSGNHNQSLDRALELVDAAAASGAHALKLQTYKADTITLNCRGGDFDINDKAEFLIGGGIGFSSYNDEIKTVGGSTGLSYDEDFMDLASRIKTGFNYSISDQTHIQATYGFSFVDSGIDNFTDDFTSHSYNAKFVYNF